MQKQDYAGLSRAFDMYYPDVKHLVKETEQYYGTRNFNVHENPLLFSERANLIGTFQINRADTEATLPRLFFMKKTTKTNPYFYAVTIPTHSEKGEPILYLGTSIDVASPNACSVSALTGGVTPYIEKCRTYSGYLKIMLAVKKYGSCNVYEIPTGYEDIDIRGINGITFGREMFAKQIFNHIIFEDNNSLSSEERTQKESQTTRDNKIWSAVVSFKTMVNTKPEVLDMLAKLNEPVMKKYKDDQQEITVEQNGNNITFRFKKRLLPISSEEYSAKKANELEKLIPTSAKILCQTGDTVYDKYASYVSHKFKAGGTVNDEIEKKFAKLQKKLIAFEDFIGNINNGEKRIEYGNIYLGGITHAINGSYHTFNDGTDSRISITLTEAPTLEKIKLITDIIKDLFDLDPETKVILTS